MKRHVNAMTRPRRRMSCTTISLHRVLTTLLLSLTVLVSAGAAAEVPITLVRLTSPVAPFTDATLEIRTSPGAECQIVVMYKSGPSRARGLVPLAADRAGRVAWTWRVGSNTTPGQWPIEVTCRKGEDTGALRTSFEVR